MFTQIHVRLAKINVKKQLYCLLVSIFIVGIIPITALSQSPDGEFYIVQSGDSLSKLAGKYYNDPLAYTAIIDATNIKAAEDKSVSIISDPDHIKTGQKLWIPSQLPSGHIKCSSAFSILPIDNSLQQSQTIYDVLTMLNFPVETLPSDILNHRVVEKTEDGRTYTGYTMLENDCAFLLAYYYPFKETPSRLYLLKFDKNSQSWSYQSIEYSLITGTNSVQSIKTTNNFYLIYLHINPSAGLTIIISPDMKTYHILKGYIAAVYDDDLMIYSPNQVHFASTHPSEIGIYNPFTQEAKIILPQTPAPPLWSARVDEMRWIYEQLEADNWCARNNHNCEPELFTRYFQNVTVNSGTDSLAFVADFIGTGQYDGPPHELSDGKIINVEGQRVLYIFRGIHSANSLEYREIDLKQLEQKRGENFNLTDLLKKEILERLFEEEYYTNPTAIIQQVSEKGPSEIVSELWTSETKWNYVIDKISTGESIWLKVAVALRPGTDVGAAETLFSALGEALVEAPDKVLALFSDDLSIKYICSFPDVTDPRFDTKSSNLKELEKRKKSLLSLSDKNLQSVQEQCLNRLEESRKEVSEWFDAQK